MPAASIDIMPSTAAPNPDTKFPISSAIRTIRGERVILDVDLATIYGVETKVLNQAVRRNRDKFPRDFIFQIDDNDTLANMRSQIVTASKRNVRHRPYAFTEHGAIMAATILKSPQAVQMSVFVVRAFVKMRAALSDTRELARKLAALEKELTTRLDTHETAIVGVLQRIMALLDPPAAAMEQSKREMGFHAHLPSPSVDED